MRAASTPRRISWSVSASPGHVDAVAGPKLVDHQVDQGAVEVVAAQMRVAVRRQHLEDAVPDLQDRDVERAAAQVVDGDHAFLPPLEPVREARRGRLVDDAQHVQAGDAARVLRRLTLGVVEVGGHGDDRLLHRPAEVLLGPRAELAQDERRNLRRA